MKNKLYNCDNCVSRHCNGCKNFSNFFSEERINPPQSTAEFWMPLYDSSRMIEPIDISRFSPAINLEREITERMAERMSRDIDFQIISETLGIKVDENGDPID